MNILGENRSIHHSHCPDEPAGPLVSEAAAPTLYTDMGQPLQRLEPPAS